MYAFLVTLLIIDCVLLAVAVLLQAGQGGGLASLGGATSDMVLGGRQTVTLLTTSSKWLGGAFLVLALAVSLVAVNRSGGDSEVAKQLQTVPQAPKPLPLKTTPTPGTTSTPTTSTPAPTGKSAPKGIK